MSSNVCVRDARVRVRGGRRVTGDVVGVLRDVAERVRVGRQPSGVVVGRRPRWMAIRIDRARQPVGVVVAVLVDDGDDAVRRIVDAGEVAVGVVGVVEFERAAAGLERGRRQDLGDSPLAVAGERHGVVA